MRSSDMADAKVAVKRLFSSLDLRFRDSTWVYSGIPMLDSTGGLHAGEVLVLAGDPGVGKTALAISAASHAATHGAAVLWVSLAETLEQMAERFVLHQSAVPPLSLRTGRLERQHMTALTYAAATVSKWSLQVEDTVDLTAAAIRESSRTWRESETTERALIVVDCLQLVADDCDNASVLRSLLATAKETRSALLLVSQQLADAHERATLESVATAVIYLRAAIDTHEIVLAKHRYCRTPQTQEVVFDGSTFGTVPQADQRASNGA